MLLPSHRGGRYDTDGDDMKWKDMDPEEKVKIKKLKNKIKNWMESNVALVHSACCAVESCITLID